MSVDHTSIVCPSCERKICIALRPPLCSMLPWELRDSHIPAPFMGKDYTIKDLLYVHEELIKENKYLRNKVDELHNKLYGSR